MWTYICLLMKRKELNSLTYTCIMTFKISSGDSSILATSKATFPWPMITAVSPDDRLGFN